MLYDVKTSEEYLENLESGWIKDKLEEVRNVILNLGPDLAEDMEYKMLCYRLADNSVFHLNAQKSFVGLYVGSIDKVEDGRLLLEDFDLGKGCIRIKKSNRMDTGLEDFIQRTIVLYRGGAEADC